MRIIKDSIAYKLLMCSMLSGGEYPLNAIGCIDGADKNIRRAKDILCDNNLMEVKENKYGGKKLVLKLYDKQKFEYAEQIWTGATDWEIPNFRAGNANVVNRKNALAELFMFLYHAGVAIRPDTLPKELGKEVPEDLTRKTQDDTEGYPFFVRSSDVKKITKAFDREAGNCRCHGTLFTAAGIYMMYNSRTGEMDIRRNETKIIDVQKALVNTVAPWSIAYISQRGTASKDDFNHRYLDRACIVTVRKYEQLTSYFDKGHRKKDSEEKGRLYLLSGVYDNVYALPLDTWGESMLTQMMIPKWHMELNKILIPENNRLPDSDRTYIDRDGFDGERYIINFCDCDIRKLRANISIGDKDKTEYIVLAYEWQRDLLEKVLPENFTVKYLDCSEVLIKLNSKLMEA